MTYYAVIDTNVLVSAMLNFSSVPGKVAEKALVAEIIPLLNDEILAEYREVLLRPKFKFNPQKVEILLDGIAKRALFIDAENVEEQLPDPKDVVFYEVTMAARKNDNAYLITGNIKHFPAKPFVVTPREMLDIIGE